MKRLRFDVFGRELVVERSRVSPWTAYYSGTDGTRRPAGFPIPPHLSDVEVGQYLDDLLHENATAEHPEVRLLETIER